jgi:hypothetical protein
VAIAVEIKQPKGFGRVRMSHVPDASGESLLSSSEEMREFLGKSYFMKGDELLRNIELLIKCKLINNLLNL